MALTLSTAGRNAAVDAVTALLNAGGAGKVVIGTTGMGTTLVTNNFSATSFSGGVIGVATAAPISDGTVAAAGTAAAAELRNNASTGVITGLTVGVSASNINITNTTLAVNDVVSITSMTITMPAS